MPFLSFLKANARWLGGCFLLTFFSTVGQTSFIGLSAGHVRSEFGLSNGGWGAVFMIGTLASAFTLTYVGQIVDRLSALKVVLVVLPMLALACASMAFAGNVVFLVLTIYLLRLFGQGMSPHTAYTTTVRWFSGQRGRALSLVILGHNAGEALLITTFVAVSAAVGWRNGWLLAGCAVAFVALPLVAMMVAVERKPSATEVNPRVVDARDWTRAEVLRDPLFYLAMLGIMAPGFIVTVAFFHHVYLVELRGWSLSAFASSFIVWAVVNSALTVVCGQLIDRFSGLALLPFVLVPLGLASLVLGGVTAPWAPFVFMALMGVSSGLSTPLFGAIWPEIYGIANMGSIRALGISASVFASAAGPGLTGYLIDIGVPFPAQLLAMGIYCGFASLVLWYVAKTVRRRNACEQAH